MKHKMKSRQISTISLVFICGLMFTTIAQAVFVPTQLADPSRRWSVSASVMGGWNDNIWTRPDGAPDKKSSATTTLEPHLYIYLPSDQSFFALRYTYDGIYYWDRGGGDPWDHTHIVDLTASHRFNTRLQLDVTDSFRRGLSPELADMVNNVPFIRQQQGDYFYNNLNANLSYILTRLWTLTVGMTWDYWSYDLAASGDSLDRNIYTPNIGLLYTLSPSTTLGATLRVGVVDYKNPGLNNNKNSTSETAFLSLTHMFNPQLTGQVSGGAGFTTFGDDHETASPYFNANLTYRYIQNGTVSIGTSYFLYTSDQFGYRSSDTLANYLQVNQGITGKLFANLNIAYVHSEYGNLEPSLAGLSPASTKDDAWRIGLGATYNFTRWISFDANYSFDTVSADISGHAYERNRFWAGLRVTY